MLSILGIVVIIVATYQVYKTARDTGRNPAIWALITFVVGAGIQIALPIVAVMIYAGHDLRGNFARFGNARRGARGSRFDFFDSCHINRTGAQFSRRLAYLKNGLENTGRKIVCRAARAADRL
jgi:hypothetical protein